MLRYSVENILDLLAEKVQSRDSNKEFLEKLRFVVGIDNLRDDILEKVRDFLTNRVKYIFYKNVLPARENELANIIKLVLNSTFAIEDSINSILTEMEFLRKFLQEDDVNVLNRELTSLRGILSRIRTLFISLAYSRTDVNNLVQNLRMLEEMINERINELYKISDILHEYVTKIRRDYSTRARLSRISSEIDGNIISKLEDPILSGLSRIKGELEKNLDVRVFSIVVQFALTRSRVSKKGEIEKLVKLAHRRYSSHALYMFLHEVSSIVGPYLISQLFELPITD